MCRDAGRQRRRTTQQTMVVVILLAIQLIKIKI